MQRRSHLFSFGFLVLLLASAPSSAGEPVRVMSFNIRYGKAPDGENAWPHRKNMVVAVIKDADPDLLGLQEALCDQLDFLTRELDDYQRVGVGREADGKGEYSAILYRRSRFDLSDAGTFWLSDTPEEPGSRTWGNELPRICTWARLLDRTSGKRLLYLNTHWDHQSQPARRQSGKLMGRRVLELARDDEPAIITGDFNASPENPAFRALLEEGGLHDTFRKAHPDEKDVNTFNGFGRPSGVKIDAVVVTDHWETQDAKIVRTRVDGRFPSDHFPVTATLVLRDDEADDSEADDQTDEVSADEAAGAATP
jgi:endonuclease/exonuclease/phosphatase family metal-dependent hydrolase